MCIAAAIFEYESEEEYNEIFNNKENDTRRI